MRMIVPADAVAGGGRPVKGLDRAPAHCASTSRVRAGKRPHSCLVQGTSAPKEVIKI